MRASWTRRKGRAPAALPRRGRYFGGLGGFGGLSGLGLGPFGFSAFGAGGGGSTAGGGASATGAGGSTAGGGGGAGVRGDGAGFGSGAAFFAAFFAGVDAAGFMDVAFVAFGVGEGSAGVPAGSTGVDGSTESSRGARVVVGPSTLVSVTATGSGARSTSVVNPLPGIEGAGPGGVAISPSKPPMAKPTKMPTIDWIDFESTGRASRMTRGTSPDYPYLY
jgi:hypothetical protein